MKRIILQITLFVFLLIISSSIGQVYAQKTSSGVFDQPSPVNALAATPTPSAGGSQHQSIANCDRCGYCRDMGDVKAPQAPSYWKDCKKCLYKGVTSDNPIDNLTLIAIPTPDPDHYYIVGMGCLSTVPAEFVTQVTRIFFSIVGAIAFIFLLYGALVIATSQENPDKLNYGKKILYGAIIGVIFALSAIFIIR